MYCSVSTFTISASVGVVFISCKCISVTRYFTMIISEVVAAIGVVVGVGEQSLVVVGSVIMILVGSVVVVAAVVV